MRASCPASPPVCACPRTTVPGCPGSRRAATISPTTPGTSTCRRPAPASARPPRPRATRRTRPRPPSSPASCCAGSASSPPTGPGARISPSCARIRPSSCRSPSTRCTILPTPCPSRGAPAPPRTTAPASARRLLARHPPSGRPNHFVIGAGDAPVATWEDADFRTLRADLLGHDRRGRSPDRPPRRRPSRPPASTTTR